VGRDSSVDIVTRYGLDGPEIQLGSECWQGVEAVDHPSLEMAPRYELAVGLRKGHRTTKIRVDKTKRDKKHTIRPSRLKGIHTK
jgi:hypothetical protein